MLRTHFPRAYGLCLLEILFLAATPQLARGDGFFQHNLTSDIPGLADFTDPNLVNPWGISFSATSPFWVSDAGTSVATLYNGFGQPQALVVTIPPAPFSGPTGQVFNADGGFILPNGQSARFMFATLTGTISGWNAGTSAVVEVTDPTASYTGLAIGANVSGTFLYAANFRGGTIDVYNSSFARTTLSGNFSDPGLPADFHPFNIQNIGGKLYAQYAKFDPVTGRDVPGPGNGFVDVFDTDGHLLNRLVTRGDLNSPWGVTLAPASFGSFGNDLLVGNFGDGTINAFDPITGMFVGELRDADGNPIVNSGLWALAFGNGGSGFDPNTLYFTAGIAREQHGLFGSLGLAPVPEPGTMALLSTGLGGLMALCRRRRREEPHS